MVFFFFFLQNIKATLSKEIQAFHKLTHTHTRSLNRPHTHTHTKTPTNTDTYTHICYTDPAQRWINVPF